MKLVKQLEQLQHYRVALAKGETPELPDSLPQLGLDADVPGLADTTFRELAGVHDTTNFQVERDLLLYELQQALVLEHATIPPYMTALYTLASDSSWQAIEVLRSVMVEEMLHMTLVANLINALGGAPDTASPDFLPDYPAPLPFDVDGIQVNLFGFSRAAVEQGCLIERPRDIRPDMLQDAATPQEHLTIGEFYLRIELRLRFLVETYGEAAVFVGDPKRQVGPPYYYDGAGATFVIADMVTALLALETIRHQGEGFTGSIWSGNRETYNSFPEVAHFFRFNELLCERSYRLGDTVESGPTGKPFKVNWAAAIPIRPNSKLSDYRDAPEIRASAMEFNQAYCDFLRMLDRAFNGQPSLLQAAIGEMFGLKNLMLRLINNPLPDSEQGFHAAPTFEYMPAQAQQPTDASLNPSKEIVMQKALPSVPAPLTMPFYYASLNNCIVHFLVDPERVEPFLEGTVLRPAIFDGKASVAFNFQAYAGLFSGGVDQPPAEWATSCIGVTQELELNIVAYPAAQEDNLPDISFEQWVMGDEQSKLMGNHRVFVPCDSDAAIQAGIDLFGEPKFKTTFGVNLPSYNPVRKPGADRYVPEWVETWGFKVNDPDTPSADIFTCVVDMSGLPAVPGNISSITEYGTHDDRPIACRWNILQPFKTFFLDAREAARVQLSYGDSSHPMQQAMKALLDCGQVAAVQTFVSTPAAIQSRAVFL
jgi:Ferritin-like